MINQMSLVRINILSNILYIVSLRSMLQVCVQYMLYFSYYKKQINEEIHFFTIKNIFLSSHVIYDKNYKKSVNSNFIFLV